MMEHLSQVFVNVVYLWQHTIILTAKCILQLPPGLQSMIDDPARINCVRDHIVLRRTERYDASVQLPQLRRQQ